ncbi:ATP-binding cassette domain-containing protein, partial [Candidatus Bipolaricaulota bacterium]|nr:ATP-binding cassette domain-containing protein [Candidatus Bipolaricaulota bacterium]
MSSSNAPRIEIRGLSVQFPGRERPALDDVSARIAPGQTLAITGPSGCGKTTLLRTLAGFIPDMIHADVSGEIWIDDQPLTAINLEQLSSVIGLVQQDPDAQVCTLRVRSEVAFGPENLCLTPQEIESRVTHALGALGIAHLVGRDTTSLSGGEKQRLAVAAILAMRPSVILLDEPTAHLDPAGARDLFDLLRELQQQTACTLLIVEHRLPPLRTLDPKLWIMDSGRLVERNVARVHEDITDLTRKVSVDRSAPNRSKTPQGALRIEHLSFGYQERLLEDLSLTLEPGMILGVIGPNGGGKTTLLRLMAALERPDEGAIVHPDDMTVGMVFQHPHQQIFERTVRRDLEIEGALDEVHLASSLASARLSGLADVPPQSLSLGEQRRLTVLAALRGAPDLLLLDEPFIGQDRDNVAWIVGRIRQARDRGAMICLVTHDIPMVDALCDRLLYLGDRTILGSPQDVFSQLREGGSRAFTPEFW